MELKMTQAKNFIETHGLENYVSPNRNEERSKELVNLISQIPEKLFGIESLGYEGLKKKLKESAIGAYPVLDLSFLSMSSSEYALSCRHLPEDRLSYLSIPKFAVYSLDNPKFEVMIEANRNPKKYAENGIEWNYYWISLHSPNVERSNLGNIVVKSIFESISEIDIESTPKSKIVCPRDRSNPREFYSTRERYSDEDIELVDYENFMELRKTDEKFEEEKRFFIDSYRFLQTSGFKISTFFTEVLPVETRNQIQTAQRMFDEEDIYIIAEAQNWIFEEPARMRDPLVVAITEDNGKGYLIDQFYPTPAEDYVAREFTTGDNTNE
jgi:hypothetical protein